MSRNGDDKLSGLQKSAILLITLGPEKSANIFRHLKEEEIEEKVDVDRFLSTIEDKDKQILQMRAEGYTNQEIADRLGYKTHSAIVKRIKKLGRMYQDFSGLNFGFS